MTPRPLTLNSFATACYDQNTVEELEAALAAGPDTTDMRTWRLSAADWIEQVEAALAAKRADADAT